MTSSWFFLSTLNYDARSTTHQINKPILFSCGVRAGRIWHRAIWQIMPWQSQILPSKWPLLFSKYHSGEQIEKNEACGNYGEHERAYRDLVREPERRRPPGRPSRRWENDIKMYIEKKSWYEEVDSIELAQERDKWRHLVTTNFRVPQYAGNCFTSWARQTLCYMKLVSYCAAFLRSGRGLTDVKLP